MIKFWKYIQFLSLDVVAGALISSLFIAKTLGVGLRNPMLVGLGIAIWLIYTIDHLIDAKAIKGSATNPRHAFHQKYFIPMVVLAVIAFGVGLWNIYFLPIQTIKFGGVLVFCVGVYFLTIRMVNRKLLLHKEISAALIYSFGIFAAPLSMSFEIDGATAFLFLEFMILVLINLLVFPLFEIDSDKADHMKSLPISIGEDRVRRIVNWLLGLMACLLLVGWFGFSDFWSVWQWKLGQAILLSMFTIMTAISWWPGFF